MTQRSARQAGSMTLLTISATAARLGCSDMHVYRLISSGELDAVDISQPGALRSKTRVRSDDVDGYIEARTRRTGQRRPRKLLRPRGPVMVADADEPTPAA